MYGYRDDQGRIVATSPNDMSGNTGWEEVPEGTVAQEPQEETGEGATEGARLGQVEAALIELAGMIGGE